MYVCMYVQTDRQTDRQTYRQDVNKGKFVVLALPWDDADRIKEKVAGYPEFPITRDACSRITRSTQINASVTNKHV